MTEDIEPFFVKDKFLHMQLAEHLIYDKDKINKGFIVTHIPHIFHKNTQFS